MSDIEEGSEERRRKDIETYQIAQQQLQLTTLQRQQMKMQSEEIEHALGEMKKTTGDVFRIVGPILVHASKEEAEKDLLEKREFLTTKAEVLEKQEDRLKKTLMDLRKNIESGESHGHHEHSGHSH
jgi:prefoldin beta subunit